MILLLASWLATSNWHWDASEGATYYRLRWSVTGKAWCEADKIDINPLACSRSGDCHGNIPMPPGDIAFIIVTSGNEYGESGTEHGPITACASFASRADTAPALAVTRHRDATGICLFVSGIDPAATAIQFRATNPNGPSGGCAIPQGTETFCVPLRVSGPNQGFYEVRQCYGPSTQPLDCEVTYYREKLCCGPGTGGCDTDFYHTCQGTEP